MPGIFSDVDQQNQMATAARAPVAGPTTSASDSFSAALTQSETNDSAYSKAFNESDFIQSKLDEYKAKTGESLSNPGLQSPLNPLNNFIYNQRLQSLRDQFAAKSKEMNDPTIAFPSDDEIAQGGIGLARAATLRQEQLGSQSQAFGAGVAGFVGGQIVSLPSNAAAIATIPEGGLGMKMLGSAAGFGGVQLFNDLTQYGYRKAVNPNYGPGQIAKDVAEQAAGGAAFELGGKLVGDVAGAIWRRFKGVAPEVADRVPQETQDAGNVAERVADWNAQNPFHGPEGSAAHNEAIVKVEQDMQAERPVELPPAAEEANAAPQPDEIDAHARATNPVLFDLTDKVEGQIADVRAKIGEVAGSVFEKDIPVEQGLRVQLNELQMQRAAMGPEVNAARQEAQQFLAGHPEAAPPAVREPLPEPTTLELPRQQVGEKDGFINTNAQASRDIADKRGVTPKIESAFAEGGTVNQVAKKLDADISFIPASERKTFLTEIRATLGIPSRSTAEGEAEFQVWKATRDKRSATAVSAATAKEAFGDPVTIDAAAAHPFKNINRMAEALEGAAGPWRDMRAAAKRGDIPAGQDITPHVMMAVRALVRAKDEGKTLGEVMNEGPEFQSDTGQLAAGLFFDKDSGKFLSKNQMTANLKSLADGLREGTKVEGEPGAPPVSTDRDAAVGRLVNTMTGDTLDMSKGIDDPKVHDAMLADLQRNIEQGRNRVPSYDADGKVQAGVADAELAAIERQEAAANEIANCTAPVAEAAE